MFGIKAYDQIITLCPPQNFLVLATYGKIVQNSQKPGGHTRLPILRSVCKFVLLNKERGQK